MVHTQNARTAQNLPIEDWKQRRPRGLARSMGAQNLPIEDWKQHPYRRRRLFEVELRIFLLRIGNFSLGKRQTPRTYAQNLPIEDWKLALTAPAAPDGRAQNLPIEDWKPLHVHVLQGFEVGLESSY